VWYTLAREDHDSTGAICLERILEEIARLKPALVIVDSVQTVFSLKFQSAPGSIGQVREAATQLLFTAKGQNIFAGLGQYALTYTFTNRSDKVNPVKNVSFPGFKGNAGVMGITYQTGSFLTGYFGFPIEAIPSQADRQAVLSRFLQQATCQ